MMYSSSGRGRGGSFTWGSGSVTGSQASPASQPRQDGQESAFAFMLSGSSGRQQATTSGFPTSAGRGAATTTSTGFTTAPARQTGFMMSGSSGRSGDTSRQTGFAPSGAASSGFTRPGFAPAGFKPSAAADAPDTFMMSQTSGRGPNAFNPAGITFMASASSGRSQPDDVPPRLFPVGTVAGLHPNIYCDGCRVYLDESRAGDARYHCMICPDMDFCTVCVQDARITAARHDVSHPILAIPDSTKLESQFPSLWEHMKTVYNNPEQRH